jgi:hypothetical protein
MKIIVSLFVYTWFFLKILPGYRVYSRVGAGTAGAASKFLPGAGAA